MGYKMLQNNLDFLYERMANINLPWVNHDYLNRCFYELFLKTKFIPEQSNNFIARMVARDEINQTGLNSD